MSTRFSSLSDPHHMVLSLAKMWGFQACFATSSRAWLSNYIQEKMVGGNLWVKENSILHCHWHLYVIIYDMISNNQVCIIVFGSRNVSWFIYDIFGRKIRQNDYCRSWCVLRRYVFSYLPFFVRITCMYMYNKSELMMMIHSSTTSKLVDLIPAFHQSHCQIPN